MKFDFSNSNHQSITGIAVLNPMWGNLKDFDR